LDQSSRGIWNRQVTYQNILRYFSFRYFFSDFFFKIDLFFFKKKISVTPKLKPKKEAKKVKKIDPEAERKKSEKELKKYKKRLRQIEKLEGKAQGGKIKKVFFPVAP
jgi:uncharacterized membrane protein